MSDLRDIPKNPWLSPLSPTAAKMTACECTVVKRAASATEVAAEKYILMGLEGRLALSAEK